MKKQTILTGDRPTGRLHLGHYVGSLKNRVELQEKYETFIMVADTQALTDNFDNPKKIKDNILNVILDYLSVGIDPEKSSIFIQSSIRALPELTMYYMNLVHLGRLQRNPTIKTELKQRGFEKSIPVGFLTYPISQAADVTAFQADLVPVGEDQLPIMEQVNEIVKSFNSIYGETLTMPKTLVPESKCCRRLPGIDGKAKMSKSSNNCIYLSDTPDIVKEKVMRMYTDPNHIKVEDKGNTKDNAVFIYLDALMEDREKFNELKSHYERGGLGDVSIKKELINEIERILTPIREKRSYYENNLDKVYKIISSGNKKANEKADNTLDKVKSAIGIDCFIDFNK